MENYIEVSKNEPLAKNPFANFIRKGLPSYFAEIIPNPNRYDIRGSPGIGSWAAVPWIGFLNRDVSSTFKEGYYVAFLFKEDMSGFYLTLMFGLGNSRNFNVEELSRAGNLGEFIQFTAHEIVNSPMKLRKGYNGSNVALRYEKSVIYSIEYNMGDLPSENRLRNDLSLLLGFYDVIYENNFIELFIQNDPKILQESGNIILDDEGIYVLEKFSGFVKKFHENYPIFKPAEQYSKTITEIITESTQNSNLKSLNEGHDFKHHQRVNITIADSTTFYRPVLELYKDGRNHRNAEIVEEIRKILPDDEKNSDKVNAWVSFPIKHFYDAGCLEKVMRGVHCITEDGLKLLEMDIKSLDRKVLKECCPKFREKYSRNNSPYDNGQLGSDPQNIGDEFASKNGPTEKKYDGGADYAVKISEIESKPNKYYNKKHSNKYKKLGDLLSEDNIEKLEDIYILDEEQFDNIIENIIKTHKRVLDKLIQKYKIDFEKLNILEKMLIFSKSFVKTNYTSSADLGYYRFNEIFIDEREPTNYKKIRTIIHELSHFLLSEILEQVLSYVLDADKTDILEAFVFYILTDVNDFYLIDEYCACTVEGEFIIRGHQDYTSFKNALGEGHDFSNEDLVIYGNTFARYIILIMKSFLNEDLIKIIRKEGSEVNISLKDIPYQTDEYLEWDEFKDILGQMLTYKTDFNMVEAETVIDYSIKIKENNK